MWVKAELLLGEVKMTRELFTQILGTTYQTFTNPNALFSLDE